MKKDINKMNFFVPLLIEAWENRIITVIPTAMRKHEFHPLQPSHLSVPEFPMSFQVFPQVLGNKLKRIDYDRLRKRSRGTRFHY